VETGFRKDHAQTKRYEHDAIQPDRIVFQEAIMHDHMMGPFWGNVVVVAIGGAITIGCIAAMFRMLFHPGENDPDHVKRRILREDR
jgi:hypothetical protein